jgi:hypothetical protein
MRALELLNYLAAFDDDGSKYTRGLVWPVAAAASLDLCSCQI